MGIPGGKEGSDLPQTNGLLTPEACDDVNSHQLLAGHDYVCQVCGRTITAPGIYRCVCGLRICNGCSSDHESG